MLFGELIKAQSWSSIEATLMLYFPKYQSSMTGFKRAFLQLQTIEPQPDSGTLKIKHIAKNNVDAITECNGQECSIIIMPWAEVLGNKIDAQTLAKFSQSEIATFVLWGITFYGFDEETIKKKTDEWLKELK